MDFFPKEFKTRNTCDPAILHLSMYPKEMRPGRDRPSVFIINTHAEP